MLITISLASNVTNELVAACNIMEKVKRLAGNEIELGMMIRRSNVSTTKKYTSVMIRVCHNRSRVFFMHVHP